MLQNETKTRKMLSFPWVAWEILAYIKRTKVFENGGLGSLEPVHDEFLDISEVEKYL